MKIRDERGAVMLESTYCILISIIVLMFMLSFGFFLYQNAVVTIITNEAAELSECKKRLGAIPRLSLLGNSRIVRI